MKITSDSHIRALIHKNHHCMNKSITLMCFFFILYHSIKKIKILHAHSKLTTG